MTLDSPVLAGTVLTVRLPVTAEHLSERTVVHPLGLLAVGGKGAGSCGAGGPGLADWREVYVLDFGPAFPEHVDAVEDRVLHRR
jgi:hypothetical protein